MPMKEKNEIVRNMHYAVLIIWMPDLDPNRKTRKRMEKNIQGIKRKDRMKLQTIKSKTRFKIYLKPTEN